MNVADKPDVENFNFPPNSSILEKGAPLMKKLVEFYSERTHSNFNKTLKNSTLRESRLKI